MTKQLDATAILMAGGQQRRWGGPGLKQMAPMFDRPIIWHTLDAIRDAIIAAGSDQYDKIITGYDGDTPHVLRETTPDPWCRGLLQTRRLWGERNVALLGDVYFTDETWSAIRAAYEDGLHFIGRAQPSRYTGGAPEVFAVTWHAKHGDDLNSALSDALEHEARHPMRETGYDQRGCPLATPWQPYRILAGLDVNEYQYEQSIWVDCDNWTDDVDDFRRYQIYRRRCELRIPLSTWSGTNLGLWPQAAPCPGEP